MISVYLRETRILPAQLELTPGNSLPPLLPSVSTQHFFLSGDVLWQNSVLKPLHKAVSCRYPLRRKFKEGNAYWFEWIKMKLIRNVITKQFANNLKTWTSYFTPYLYTETGAKGSELSQPAYGISHLNGGLLELWAHPLVCLCFSLQAAVMKCSAPACSSPAVCHAW